MRSRIKQKGHHRCGGVKVITMSEKIQKSKGRFVILFPLSCILIGMVFCFFPDWIVNTLSLLLGILCALYGTWRLIDAIRGNGFSRVGAVIGGVLAIVFGAYVIRNPENVFSLLPLAASIFFLFDGIDRIRSAAIMHRAAKRSSGGMRNHSVFMQKQKKRWMSACLIGVLTIAFSIFLLFNPFSAIQLTLRVIGVFIIFNGIGALWIAHVVDVTVHFFDENKTRRVPDDGKYNAEFRDITGE